MTITSVFVCCRETALTLFNKSENIIWISISNKSYSISRDNNHIAPKHKNVLRLKFDDITERNNFGSFTKNQARKIKNFIINKHVNSSVEWKLMINCVAGISRSAAVGKFCETVLHNIPVIYEQKIIPNKLVLELFGIF